MRVPGIRSKVKTFCDYLRFELGWDIGSQRLRHVLLGCENVISYGKIAVTKEDIEHEQDVEAEHDKLLQLPTVKEKKVPRDADATNEAVKQARADLKQNSSARSRMLGRATATDLKRSLFKRMIPL